MAKQNHFFLPSYLIYQNVFVYSQTENNKEETKTLSKEKYATI